MTAVVAEAAAARPSGRTRRSVRGLGLVGPMAVLALLFVYPIAMVIRQTFQDRVGHPAGAVAWGEVLSSPQFRNAALTTIETAVASTVCCVVIGTFIAIVLAFVPFPGAASLARLTTVILAFPSFFIALSFGVLYGRVGVASSLIEAVTGRSEAMGGFVYTKWVVVLAEVTFYSPFVVRSVYAACQRVRIEQLQVAASLGAKPWRVTREVLLPELLPSIVAGGTLTLLLTLNEFGIVLFIGAKGVTTLPVLIYSSGILRFDYPSAAVLACVQVALSLLLYGAGRALAHRLGGRRAALD